MTYILLQIIAMLSLGVIWSVFRPAGLDIAIVRNAISNSVFYVFLPALIIDILWHAPLDITSFKISASAAIGITGSLLLAYWICRLCRNSRDVTGAIMLAAAFPNATYIGLPLLEHSFGSWARSIVIQFDMFACFPLVMTLGIYIANRYGNHPHKDQTMTAFLKAVPLWAVVLAVMLNVFQIEPTPWIAELLGSLGNVVIPLMLFSTGLALTLGLKEWRKLTAVVPVAFIQLLFMPMLVWLVANGFSISGETLKALVIEAAIPSMALGITLSDRYGLNTGVYAAAFTLTTLLSFISLPLWFEYLS